ncbi:MAG: GTPase domain-containing protein [Alphaproteobacteria bacterium]|nr:GTPase domain-containing protein [Alphaproteobacteria bacterium]
MNADNQSDETLDQSIADQAGTVAPVIWLLGKVQAGKSSIVRALTGATEAEVGSGFRACTKTASVYDFPANAPLVRFLDTRGLGEANYDPQEDLEFARGVSHCTIAVLRAMDAQQDAVLHALHEIRRRHPEWPIVVAQTHLHEGYQVGADHPIPYPFTSSGHAAAKIEPTDDPPQTLVAALNRQREAFRNLPGTGQIAFVPIDFTKDGDGYQPVNYGLPALQDAITRLAPGALTAALADAGEKPAASSRRHHALIVGYATAAAAADLVPIAAAAAVPAVQAKLLHALAANTNDTWTRRMSLEFAGALGVGAITRYAAGFGIRQLTKLIPAYGQTVGATASAATSFATTYALGKAAEYYLEHFKKSDGNISDEVKDVWTKSLREAFASANKRGYQDAGADASASDDKGLKSK